LPFLFATTHAHRVLDGPVGQKVAASLEPHGIKRLAWMESGCRNMITIRKRIGAPDDMRGMKFRVMENPVYVSMFRNLGSSGVPIPSPEVYTSLQTGGSSTATSIRWAPTWASRLRGRQACRVTGHAYTAAPILMDLAAFRRLGPAEQEGLLHAAQEAAVHERAYVPKTLQEFKAKLASRECGAVLRGRLAYQCAISLAGPPAPPGLRALASRLLLDPRRSLAGPCGLLKRGDNRPDSARGSARHDLDGRFVQRLGRAALLACSPLAARFLSACS
jgi:hypothetical protein